jgi:hypothetical protein
VVEDEAALHPTRPLESADITIDLAKLSAPFAIPGNAPASVHRSTSAMKTGLIIIGWLSIRFGYILELHSNASKSTIHEFKYSKSTFNFLHHVLSPTNLAKDERSALVLIPIEVGKMDGEARSTGTEGIAIIAVAANARRQRRAEFLIRGTREQAASPGCATVVALARHPARVTHLHNSDNYRYILTTAFRRREKLSYPC